jgi:hypothetical protein
MEEPTFGICKGCPDYSECLGGHHEDCEIGSNYIHKPLSKFQNNGVSIPINAIYALDDYDATFSKNKDNGLHIPAYEPSFDYNGILEDERSLLNVMYWFTNNDVMNTTDVRKLDKSNCFAEPKIKFESIPEFLSIIGLLPHREIPDEMNAIYEEDNELVNLAPKN